ncbi:MAG: SPBc2 prophage-derived glycosyltransferase SunS [Verrucomicrobia bacterium ADurb.Bin018]|jgi:glycosyltransferase involved in cell wall biosynthesis|nr:MAG: SPBc2 prophage-derived glycosyltransferase SunS [Verrucomicrobia bacterium ADurb.Bin018]
MRPDHLKISACVTAGNEEDKIAACLASLTWCDEVIVVDSFSTDRTFEISRQYTPHVYQHAWEGYIAQKNYIRTLARYPWILFVDADEVVSDELRQEIEAEFARGPGEIVAYQFPRMVYYLGKWIRHGEWYPDIKLRLFLKDRGHSAGEEPHDRVVVDGPIKTLRFPLHHFTYDDVTDHLNTLNRFSTISAAQKYARGEKFRWRDLVFRPPWRLFKSLFIKRGILDGRQGLIIAVMTTFGVFIKYAKLMELWIKHHQPQGDHGHHD